jgi:hypothetical protein
MGKIYIADLKQAFARIISKLQDENCNPIELPGDLYRFIPTDKWDRFDVVTVEEGSLYDDLKEIESLARDDERPCTYVDFDRVASLLRALSQKNNPVE